MSIKRDEINELIVFKYWVIGSLGLGFLREGNYMFRFYVWEYV